MKLKLLVFLITILLINCATPYRQKGLMGGFSETQVTENSFRVHFRGNGYTDRERAIDYCLLRCAELAIENGYNYFIIVDEYYGEKKSLITTPSSSQTTATGNIYGKTFSGTANTTTKSGQTTVVVKPKTENQIVCFVEEPAYDGIIYSAEFVKSSIRGKYHFQTDK